MDIKREPPKQTKKYIGIALGLIGIVAVSVGISRLKPAAPPVEKGTLWFDTVKRGEMKREVNAPGTLPLKGQISMVQALAMAGGFKDFAKKKDIVIQRKSATGVTSVPFNYNDAIKGRTTMVYVQPGDTIIVP